MINQRPYETQLRPPKAAPTRWLLLLWWWPVKADRPAPAVIFIKSTWVSHISKLTPLKKVSIIAPDIPRTVPMTFSFPGKVRSPSFSILRLTHIIIFALVSVFSTVLNFAFSPIKNWNKNGPATWLKCRAIKGQILLGKLHNVPEDDGQDESGGRSKITHCGGKSGRCQNQTFQV